MRHPSAAKLLLVVCLVCALFAGCSHSPQADKARFMGRRLYGQKDKARAILEWKNAVDDEKGDPEPSYWLGMAYLGAGNIASAAASSATG